jgi:SAM-dependent methyltransferase
MKAKRGQREKYVSPYAHDLLPESEGTRRSARFIIDFIGNRKLGKVLDIGCPNPLGALLEKHYNLKLDNTEIDLDIGELSGKYDTIFCFEVIEHLFNPLHFLFQIRRVLKDDGRLYITTPKCKPYFLWSKVHFHEFHQRELIDLIERARLKTVRMKCVKVRPLCWYFTGFRPFLRLFFERRFLIESKKSNTI